MNNISTHQGLVLDLEKYILEHIPDSGERDTVFLRYNKSDYNGIDKLRSQLNQGSRETVYIVLLESTETDKVQKIAALFWRTRAMFHITRCMRKAGHSNISRLALFPNADTARIIYQLATDASRYTEYNLLPQPRGRILSLLVRFVSVVLGCSPRIDAVAIVSRS